MFSTLVGQALLYYKLLNGWWPFSSQRDGSSSHVRGLRATQNGRSPTSDRSYIRRDVMKDEPATLGVADDCHIAENNN